MTDFGIPQNTLDIWRRGVELADAIDRHGDNPEARGLLRDARRQERENKINQQRDQDHIKENWRAMFNTIPKHIAPLQTRMNAKLSRLQALLSLLKEGELIAFGYPVHDTQADDPVQIPAFMFDLKFADLKRSRLEGYGRHYTEVRVSSTLRQPPVPQLPKPVGRPTMSADIDAAISSLKESGVRLNGPPWKAATNLVRERGLSMGLRSFVGMKPDPETIRRRLVAKISPQNS